MGGCVGGEDGGGGSGMCGGGGLCLLGGASGVDPWRLLKMGSRKVPRLEKALEDTSQRQRASSGGILSVLVRFFSEEVALVTFTSSGIPPQVLSILKVPLRTHQEDDSQVKSSLPVRDFTQISSSQLRTDKKRKAFFFLKLYLGIPSTQDPQIFTGQG